MTFLPIVGRELSVAARRPATYWLRFWAALAVLVVWFILLTNTGPGIPRSELGHHLLIAMGVLAFAYTLFAGMLRTADCLAEEKREGTLGLLFLTDLRAYDVVLGKLAANSLGAVFVLVAVLPIMWLAVLLGGVTPGEFWRLSLVLLATLFFSLSIGMLVSAVSRETRQALGASFLVITVITGVLPALWWLQKVTINRPELDCIMLPSPAFAMAKAFANSYGLWGGPQDFWRSLAVIFGMSFMCIIVATLILPRVWQEKGRRKTRAREIKHRIGDAAVRLRARWLDWNPIFWLALRDLGPRRLLRWIFAILIPVWAACVFAACNLRTSAEVPFIISVFVAYALHMIVKAMIATEASRRLNQDRQSGALELLLVTPVRVHAIVAGLRRALFRNFAVAIGLLLFLNVGLCAVVSGGGSALRFVGHDRDIFMELFIGGMFALVIDFFALSWVGMWQGLRAKQHHRAVMAAIMRVMGIPWMFIFLLIFIQPRGGPGEMETIFAFFFILSAVVSLVTGVVARRRLKREFRLAASGRFSFAKAS